MVVEHPIPGGGGERPGERVAAVLQRRAGPQRGRPQESEHPFHAAPGQRLVLRRGGRRGVGSPGRKPRRAHARPARGRPRSGGFGECGHARRKIGDAGTGGCDAAAPVGGRGRGDLDGVWLHPRPQEPALLRLRGPRPRGLRFPLCPHGAPAPGHSAAPAHGGVRRPAPARLPAQLRQQRGPRRHLRAHPRSGRARHGAGSVRSECDRPHAPDNAHRRGTLRPGQLLRYGPAGGQRQGEEQPDLPRRLRAARDAADQLVGRRQRKPLGSAHAVCERGDVVRNPHDDGAREPPRHGGRLQRRPRAANRAEL